MEINNSFTVDVAIDKAWELLTDLEGIAPCLPGAKLTSVEDEVYSGGITIKVGPVTTKYEGTAEFVERDEVHYKCVISGKGRDTRGAGNAQALITAQMVAQSRDQTRIDIVTDLKVSGKVAQFGRGVMQDVSTKLLDQFADCLEKKIAAMNEPEVVEPATVATSAAASAATAAAASETPQDTTVDSTINPASSDSGKDDDEVLDLGDIGLGSVVAKQAAPAVGALIGAWLLVKLFGKLRRSSSSSS